VVAALLVGLGLRFVNLAGLPPALHQDEAVNGYDAYSLWLTGRDHNGHPFPFAGLESFGDWASPLLTFLTAPAVGLFGLRVEVVRAVPALVGALAIPGLYQLGVELLGSRLVGVVAAWLIAVSPWAVHRGHFAIPPSIVPTMVTLTLLALAWAGTKQRPRAVILVACVGALAIASYPTMKLYVPLLLLAAACLYARVVLQMDRTALAAAAAIFVVFAGPTYYLSIVDPAGRARFEQVSIFAQETPTPAFMAWQYASYFSPGVLFRTGTGHPAQTPASPGTGIEPLASAPLLLAGLAGLAARALRPVHAGQRQGALLVLSALALYPIPGSLTIDSPHMGRGIQLIPLLALIGAYGVVATVRMMRRTIRHSSWLVRGPLVLASVFLALSLVLELGNKLRDYFTIYAQREDVLQYFEFGLEPAVRFALAHQADYDEIWIADTNEPYIYVLFYGQWPPSVVHTDLRVQRHPPEFNEVDSFGRFHFGDWSTELDPEALAPVERISDANGEPAYEIRSGLVGGSRRVLFIDKPRPPAAP